MPAPLPHTSLHRPTLVAGAAAPSPAPGATHLRTQAHPQAAAGHRRRRHGATPAATGGSANRVELAQRAFAEQRWSGFWRRVAAYWIDSLLLYLPLLLGFGLWFWWAGAEVSLSQIGLYGLWALLFVLLQGWLLGGASVATPGRAMAGIAVVDAASGAPLGRGRALLRALLSVVSYLVLLPHLAMLFTPRKQTVADLASRAVVVAYRPVRTARVLATLLSASCVLVLMAAVEIRAYQSTVLQARLPSVRTDLRGYALALERHWREGRPTPPSALELDYHPTASDTIFKVTGQGALIAIVEAAGFPLGSLMLVPIRTAGSDETVWRCFSVGIPEALQPPDCPSADSGASGTKALGPQAAASLN
jgi:hypothetical protein